MTRRTRPSGRGRDPARRVVGFGEAAPIARYDESAASALAWLDGVELGDDPWALDEIEAALPPGRAGGAGGGRRRAPRPAGQARGLPVYRLLGLRRDGPPTSWTVWLGDPDDMARRAERAAARGFRRLKLKLGGRDGLDLERVRAVRSVDRAAASGRRERVLDARRGARAPAADAESSTASSRCPRRRSRRARAEAPLAGPDLRRRGLPHARRRRHLRRARARDQRSSSRSRAAFARRCGWRTPHGRSASA